MMKKLFALLMAVMMVLAMAACSAPAAPEEPKVVSEYFDPLSNMIDVMYRGKTDKVEAQAPAMYWDWLKAETGKDMDAVIDEAKANWETRKAELEEKYGANFQVRTEMKAETDLTEEELDTIAESLKKFDGFERDALTAGKRLPYQLFIEGSKYMEQPTAEIIVVQYDEVWYQVTPFDSYGASASEWAPSY